MERAAAVAALRFRVAAAWGGLLSIAATLSLSIDRARLAGLAQPVLELLSVLEPDDISGDPGH